MSQAITIYLLICICVQITPAHGEMVAALYPLDDQWYRARVITTTRADQNVEVCFIITIITKFLINL